MNALSQIVAEFGTDRMREERAEAGTACGRESLHPSGYQLVMCRLHPVGT
jgi:hypothetical protein